MPSRLKAALEKTGYKWAHFGWSHKPEGDYGVWGEERGRDFTADNSHAETATVCFASYFTRDDSGAPRRKIEAELNALRFPWRLNSIQYEDDTGYIHFEWLVTVLGDGGAGSAENNAGS